MPAAESRGSSTSSNGARRLSGSGILLVLLLVSIAGLHEILQDIGWWFAAAGLSTLLVVVGAAARYLFGARSRILAPVAGIVVLIVTVTVSFAPQNALLGLIPTAGTVGDFGALVVAADQSIATQSLPAIAGTPILFLICVGIGAIAISADYLVTVLRTPAVAGIPILVLLAVPALVSMDATDPVVFVGAALAYLALIAPAPVSQVSPVSQVRRALPLAAAIVVGTVIVPFALPAVIPGQSATGTGLSTGINPVITLGQNLRQDIEHTVLTYSTRSGNSEYLRIVNVDNFTGSSWSPSKSTLDRSHSTNAIGAPPGLSGEVKTTRESSTISIKGLTSPWLPLPYPTVALAGLQGNWYWDANSLVVHSPSRTAENQNYEATSVTINPTPIQLEHAGKIVPPHFEKNLALPANMPTVIGETANRIAGQASSNYQKALLLQDFFRLGDFTYSETAPVSAGYDGTSVKVIAAFLTAKSGYCVHFASSMAVMARILGIPSRIAVGFLPGTRNTTANDANSFMVTSHNLHAWPELYFEGIGWTRFEPTVSRGSLPDYANVASADVPTPVNAPTAATAPTALPKAAATIAPQPTSPGAKNAERAAAKTSVFTVNIAAPVFFVLLMLMLLLPALLRVAQRARRLAAVRSGGAGAVLAWRELMQSAGDLGISSSETATPREAAAVLSVALALPASVARGGRLAPSTAGRPTIVTDASRLLVATPAPAQAAIERLREAVERESYSSTPGAAAAANAADAILVVAALSKTATPWRRLRALLAPPSAVALVRSWFGRSAQ